jgi:hypothetical protein
MNSWCETLGIDVPVLDVVLGHPDANTYALLMVALLEQGAPMSLAEVAERLAEAGHAPATQALRSLKRCRPARAPVYRVGDRYTLDPHDRELDLWAFRLGLRPPRSVRVAPETVAPPARLPGPGEPLTPSEVDEAFRDQSVAHWSAQRLALAILDAYGGPLTGAAVVARLDGLGADHRLKVGAADYWRSGAIQVSENDTWAAVPDHLALRSARAAVRSLIQRLRARQASMPSPAALAEFERRHRDEQAAEEAALAALRRVILWAFPPTRPRAVTLLDPEERSLVTHFGDDLAGVLARDLASYDWVGAVDVRQLLTGFGMDLDAWRLGELGAPQKTVTLNRRGRTLRITLPMLIQGSCGISRPFGDPRVLDGYLHRGEHTKLRRRLEADAKSLHALYSYGMLHGRVRLMWGFLDEMLPAPWCQGDGTRLYRIKQVAWARDLPIEAVMGHAPAWNKAWARARTLRVVKAGPYELVLVDEDGYEVDEWEVQAARVAE